MATAYSSFFASGLLASPTRKDYLSVDDDDSNMVDAFPASKAGGRGLSPAVPSSPVAVPDDDCDTEAQFVDTRRYDRATTPTPVPVSSRPRTFSNASTLSTDSEGMMIMIPERFPSRPSSSHFSVVNVIASAGADVTSSPSINTASGYAGSSVNRAVLPSLSVQIPAAKKLRRRKSSLTSAASSKGAIKSPSRSAGHALELQKHLMGSPLKARSSSVSLAAAATDMMKTCAVVARNTFMPKENKFMARLRSGSIGSLRRKPLRRASTQPPAPPPTAPLPALPSALVDSPNCGFLEPLNAKKSPVSPAMDDFPIVPGLFSKNRDQSYSINTHVRIDEDMMEH